MPARTRPKAQPSGPKTNSSSSVTTPPPPPSLPLREYFALLSYHSALLIASFLFLPRSTKGTRLSQRSSADRPEHPFLTPLTANPLRTMAWHVVGLAVCVTWWGQHLRTWRAGSKTRDDSPASRQKRRRALADRLLETAATTLFGTVILVPVIFAFGAPLDSHFGHTVFLALHLSLLLVWPVIHALGIPSAESAILDRFRLSRLFCQFGAETPLERALVYPAVGTLIGAWIGAAPLPLDWDRPWQSYPLTVTVSSLLGYIVGGYASWAHSALEA
ncbi:hypothetical protein EHS25_003486 [Saitozyma podzolica]|uniref:Glycosylphosphatidylinositol (GPI) anchor assembly protein n=1 Tax=Saitozyma podzolica TaxID=1890683 RepID=A0A427Y7D9_9TREE|nr:hypothetical protein EHS25_003486 [Saitozyma podzolica]